MKVVGILFDKDGTLVDFDKTWGAATHAVMTSLSRGDARRFARLAQAMHFLAEERRFLASSPMIAGSTADYVGAWAEVLGRVDLADLADELDERLGAEALDALSAVGQPVEVLAELHRRGIRLGLATNDAEASARAQIERLELMPYLDFIVGYDSGHGGKPEPGMVLAFARHIAAEPGQIALVGDSLHDLMAARAAGALAIAVLSGPAERAHLESHADRVIASIAELPALIDEIETAERTVP